jgi:hypothetical protein
MIVKLSKIYCNRGYSLATDASHSSIKLDTNNKDEMLLRMVEHIIDLMRYTIYLYQVTYGYIYDYYK